MQTSSYQERLPMKATVLGQSPDKTTADMVVEYLNKLGVEYIFGVPGGAIEPLMDAVARSSRVGGIRFVLARHESGAAFMADGYARETGKLGVCCATAGPGATNLITGVANAYDNAIPMLVITGQPGLPVHGRRALQDSSCTGVNVLGMFEHCTVYNTMVSHPQQMENKLLGALQSAIRNKGPVHLTVPSDVFRAPSPTHTAQYDMQKLLRPSALVDPQEVEMLYTLLQQAKKPIFVIGGTAGSTIRSIMGIVNRYQIPFIATPDGKGFISPQHPMYRGVIGFAGHTTSEAVLQDPAVDLIIAVGASMTEWTSGVWSKSLMNNRLVHIDDNEEHLAMTPMAHMHIRGNMAIVMAQLFIAVCENPIRIQPNDELWTGMPYSNISTFVDEQQPIKPQQLMRELGNMFPPNAIYLADSGNSVAWAIHNLNPNIPITRDISKSWFRATTNFASMGWAFGAAIGTAMANPEVPVVCIAGDGSTLMNGMEISVAVAEQLNVVFVVLNDSALGMVKQGQILGGAEQIGSTIPQTDFAMLAKSLGATGYIIRKSSDLEDIKFSSIWPTKGPIVLDVRIDVNEVPPMKSRVAVLAGISHEDAWQPNNTFYVV